MRFTRVNTYQVAARGKRGLALTLPSIVAPDMGFTKGSSVSVYRGFLGGVDVLVIAKSDKPYLMDEIVAEEAILANKTQIDVSYFKKEGQA